MTRTRPPHSTTGEPRSPPALLAADGVYLELVYRVRGAGSSEFSEPRHMCIADFAYVGRRDVRQWFGPEISLPETDTQTSRFHGVFVLSRGHHLSLMYHDLGSENGSFVGNEQITQCMVAAGTTIRLGQHAARSELDVVALESIRPDPDAFWSSSTYGRLRGHCAPLRRVFAGLDALAREARDNPIVVLQGASGTGKKAATWELLRGWYGQDLPHVHYIDGRWLSAELDQHSLSDVLARRGGELLVLDQLPGLSSRNQRELGELLLRRLQSPADAQRMLVLTELDGRGLRDRGLLKLLRMVPALRLPTAAMCGADEIEAFARYFLDQYQQTAPPGGRIPVHRCALTPEAVQALRDEAWPGNWRQLQTTVETAALTTALDHREQIEPCDLPLGYSELNLPLEILFEMPLAEAEQIFRRGYLLWKLRKYAGNLSWVAPEIEFTKRGLLKTVQDIGLHDGAQVVWSPPRTWTLQNPHFSRDTNRLRVCLPSSAGWLALINVSGQDVAVARALLLALLDTYPAAAIEHALDLMLRTEDTSPTRLQKLLKARPRG